MIHVTFFAGSAFLSISILRFMNFNDCFPFGTAALDLVQGFIYLIHTEYGINRSFQRMILVKQADYLFQTIPILLYKEEIIGLLFLSPPFKSFFKLSISILS